MIQLQIETDMGLVIQQYETPGLSYTLSRARKADCPVMVFEKMTGLVIARDIDEVDAMWLKCQEAHAPREISNNVPDASGKEG